MWNVCAEMHDQNDNSMSMRSTGAISLIPNSNQ